MGWRKSYAGQGDREDSRWRWIFASQPTDLQLSRLAEKYTSSPPPPLSLPFPGVGYRGLTSVNPLVRNRVVLWRTSEIEHKAGPLSSDGPVGDAWLEVVHGPDCSRRSRNAWSALYSFGLGLG